jgi:hypothetical protein
MSSIQNTNRNNISIKTDSAAELVRELSKLGVFRKKDKKRAKRSASTSDGGIRQDNEMVGYTRTLDGPQMRNLPPIQQIQPGFTQNQIEGIQRTTDATIAALRAELEQNRSQSQQTIGGLAGAAAERFKNIQNVLGSIVNPSTERFRGSTFPAQASGDQPIDPFASSRPGVIFLGNEPDIIEERFTQTLNEGGPEAVEKAQTSLYAEEEPFAMGGGGSRLQPVSRIRGSTARNKRAAVAAQYGLEAPPILRDTNRPDMEAYYRRLVDATNDDVNQSILNSKEKMFAEINSILDSVI